MSYVRPEAVLSPRKRVGGILEVIHDPGEGGMSVARILWDGEPVIATRWNGSAEQPLGNPMSRRQPTWFVVDGYAAPKVEEAARAANVMEFVAQQPLGFATPLADRGQNLSGGQRQRISIARALLKNSPVLVLDEATAALDNESERRVQQELALLMRGRTTLVIAHRLSTVENADRIIVLDRGRIIETGTHQQLLALGGLYASLHGTQFNE